ncbi:hypothetical protein Pmani_010090 [Petrolisthes manimaculis]|uniref:Methyltransferase type 11 domain-containing protein n=1 Tax=Petrolisthes manimaculis TaxID=1843537 RepID=A0AAE1Q2A9_9EUCA|nr:hypothetical protein Pmani_010090 [Petrolisthes manimaculis]
MYSKFRPRPPTSLTPRIVSYLKEKYDGPLTAATDVGCGSGQTTHILTSHFKHVTGLDISQAQINQANTLNDNPHVSFKVSGAESLPFAATSLQLVTAGQACHWFDMKKFYDEVDRILVPGGVLALYGYLFPEPINTRADNKLKEILKQVYKEELSGYIQKGSEDVYLNNYKLDKYNMIYYKHSQIRDESHYTDRTVTVADLTGYIGTWSGLQNFRQDKGEEAAQKVLDHFESRVMSALQSTQTAQETELSIRFRYFLLLGRKP